MEQKICDGTWVTMITPFTKENKIDYPGVAEIIEWYIQKGIDGIFAVCQSSEMFCLNEDERVELARRVAVAGNSMLRQLAPRRRIDRVADLLPDGRR